MTVIVLRINDERNFEILFIFKMAMLHILKQYYRNNVTNRSLYLFIWKFFLLSITLILLFYLYQF